MDYSKFYTPPIIADILINQINVKSVKKTIDICCGSCNLLHAAKKRWPGIHLVGVDIKEHTSDDIEFFREDGREFALRSRGKYALVLANPPFDSLKKRSEYPELFVDNMAGYQTFRLENEMLLANLILLRKHGTLMIIMPSSFVEAESNRILRIMLAKDFFVEKVIRLPDDAFGTAKIRSYALIIKKKIPMKNCTNYFAIMPGAGDYIVTANCSIPQSEMRCGDWCLRKKNDVHYNIDIRRGKISSQHFVDYGLPVLHTAKNQLNWKPSIRCVGDIPANTIYAETGDILISRIGKSAGQWCIYDGEKTPISDCLFRIRDYTGEVKDKLGTRKYDYIIKGVATRYITVNDFLQWYLS